MGGEKYHCHGSSGHAPGSPPRGRGKGLSRQPASSCRRITPAWAGKSTGQFSWGWTTRDHPRVGGEKQGFRRYSSGRWGSPPRGRGKAFGWAGWLARAGITPAWAGKSMTYKITFANLGDHPRVGGEKSAFLCSARSGRGSPPRGRGKVSCVDIYWLLKGITPAWAGKSLTWSSCCRLLWDHPRVGGEKPLSGFLCIWFRGSPPRGRGKAILYTSFLCLSRITPAWAGKRKNGKICKPPR